ncbi:MAG TPA: hypothetical protein VGJ92_11355 [Methanocella sp.]|jgi:hypothetical protein
MIIEGNLLIGILIVVALAIGALVVYIRFAVKKEPSDADSLFSRLLKFGNKDEEDDAQDEANAESAPAGIGGLSLPMPGMGGGKGGGTAAGEEAPAKKGSFSIGGVFSGVLGSKKSKEKIKEEVRVIDDQLNSVLQESEEINVLGMPPQISPDDTPLSDGKGMRELDLEMGTLQGPLEIINPEDLTLSPPSLDVAPPVAAMSKPEEAANDQKKAAAPPTPVEVEAKSPVDFMADTKKGSGDDLLDDLESSAKQVEAVDMSIMKEYQDMPITCVEIESDLKNILDQITVNSQNRRSS